MQTSSFPLLPKKRKCGRREGEKERPPFIPIATMEGNGKKRKS